MAGLLIAVIGSGSVRANLTAFGGNQYKVPEQEESLKLYFSIQIVFLKIGSLMGRAINPILREDVKCFGMDDCYPLAFGIPAIAMITALLIMLSGKKFYIQKPPSDNIFLKVCCCICCGIKNFVTRDRKLERKSHWLDYAEEKYNQQLIKDTKKVLQILIVFSPFPIYWAVYMQQSSRWIFQATRTNGDIGWFTIKPDQMIALNPIFAIILMPVCNYFLFPLLAKFKIHSLLHKIAIGFVLCCLAFAIAIFVELKIEKGFISILWLFPQFAVLSLGENFAFTSMLNFAFTEGPSNMKSVMTACVFVTISFGNLIITFISGTKIFSSQVFEFLFFIGILVVALVVFLILVSRFRSSGREREENVDAKLEANDSK
jgi:dipeptide/tripeptide permease